MHEVSGYSNCSNSTSTVALLFSHGMLQIDTLYKGEATGYAKIKFIHNPFHKVSCTQNIICSKGVDVLSFPQRILKREASVNVAMK